MVDMTGAAPRASVPPEQLRYARVLGYGMTAGLAVLIVSFLAYLAGILPPQVPLEALPRLWALPVNDYLRESGMEHGWGWLTMLGKGDVLALSGIALLAGISLPCLALLVPAYARSSDRAYLAITIVLIGVLVIAASGAVAVH